jgi:hypothetical protein
MRLLLPILLLFPAVLFAQDGVDPLSGPMIRAGWTSPLNRDLHPVVDPLRREVGYWADNEQTGTVVLHFVKGSTQFEQSYGNAWALAILDRTFYDMDILQTWNI